MIDKTRCNDGKWTISRKRQFILNALRGASRRWSPINTTKKNARISRNTYVCSHCKSKVTNKNIKVDHTQPVVSTSGFVDYNTYIERLFVETDKLSALCKKCHDAKTLEENKLRKYNKRNTYSNKAVITPEETR